MLRRNAHQDDEGIKLRGGLGDSADVCPWCQCSRSSARPRKFDRPLWLRDEYLSPALAVDSSDTWDDSASESWVMIAI